MSVTVLGFVPCDKGERYVQQLIKHWAHKFHAGYSDGAGSVTYSDTTRATFTPDPKGIAIRLETASDEDCLRMQGVIERHLDRFAFREAPLNYRWSDG